jgi:hypothetical protein
MPNITTSADPAAVAAEEVTDVKATNTRRQQAGIITAKIEKQSPEAKITEHNSPVFS